MIFDEWWFKYGLEIDGIEKNEARTIWCAALNNAEALKPSHNTHMPTEEDTPLQCPCCGASVDFIEGSTDDFGLSWDGINCVCGIALNMYNKPRSVIIAAWNRRADIKE